MRLEFVYIWTGCPIKLSPGYYSICLHIHGYGQGVQQKLLSSLPSGINLVILSAPVVRMFLVGQLLIICSTGKQRPSVLHLIYHITQTPFTRNSVNRITDDLNVDMAMCCRVVLSTLMRWDVRQYSPLL
jgi:hypothetical protein